MTILITIDDNVSNDEISYILRRLARSVGINGLPSSINRIFDSNGDPVGTVEIPSPVLLQVSESPVRA